MIYAINKRTKEHQIPKDQSDFLSGENLVGTPSGDTWCFVRADADGWIPWEGGKCPLPETQKHEVRVATGGVFERAKASSTIWWEGTSVVAYRPILDAKPSKPEAPEWDGEGDRPPAGEAFEFSANGVSWEGRVMLFDDGITCLMAHRKYPANRWHYKSDDPDIRFRPIRSEEDKAVEDMLSLDCEPREGMLSRTEFCRALYRAGYRKVDKP